MQRNKGDVVCDLHFKKTDFLGNGLNRGCGVIPTLNLPSSDNFSVVIDGEHHFPEKSRTLKKIFKYENGIMVHSFEEIFNSGLDFRARFQEGDKIKDDGTELVGSLTSINEKGSGLPVAIDHSKDHNLDLSKDHNYILNDGPLTKQLVLENQKLQTEKAKLKSEVAGLKRQLYGVKKENTQIKSDKLKLGEKITALKEEIKVLKGPRYFYCDICDGKFIHKELYDVHIGSAHNVNEFKCENCNLFFAKNQHLNAHIASVHEGKKPYQCDICVTSFKTEQNLDEHILSVHEGNKPAHCGACIEGFSSLITLKKHLASVHKEKKIPCNKCDKSFSKLLNLKNHIQVVHEGKKLFPCKLCDKSCLTNAFLKKHIAIVHEKEKSFQCNICGLRTSTNQKLIRHVEGVHEGKKHDCKYCDKTYTQKEKLVSHMRLHTGKGLKECNNCDFKAENNQILKKHQKTGCQKRHKNGKIVARSTKVSKSDVEEKVGHHQFWKDNFFSRMKEYQLMNYKRYWYEFCMKSGHNPQCDGPENTPTEETFVEFFNKEKELGCSDKAQWRKYLFLKRIVFHLYGLKLQKCTKLRAIELFKTKEKGDCRSIVSKSVIEEKVGHHQIWNDDFFSRMKEYQLMNYKRYWYDFCMKSGHNPHHDGPENTPTEEIFVEFFNKEKDSGCSDKAQWRKYLFLKRIVFHLYGLKLQKFTKLRAIALFKTKLRKKEK